MVQKIHPRDVIWIPKSRLMLSTCQKKKWQHSCPSIKKSMSLLTLCTINCILRRWHGTQKFTYVSDSLTVDKFLFCKQSGTVLVGRVNNFLNFLTCDIDTMRGVDAVNFFNTQTSVTVL